MAKSLARGDRDKDELAARMREAALETFWQVNEGSLMERLFYLDLIGIGMMAAPISYVKGEPYATLTRLNPRYCFPDVRNGRLTSMVFAETMKARNAAISFPQFELDPDPESTDEITFMGYYGPQENAECLVREDNRSGTKTAYIIQRWQHGYGKVPVAFRQLDTYDGAIRGLLDQMSGPMLARNKIIRFMVDYLESLSHAPVIEMGVQNKDDLENPGPTTVIHLDDTAEKSTVYRLPPAAPATAVFGLLSYMDDQEQKEAIQPPARVGQVRQSIASGSFVASTQGQLTSVVEELQENMAAFRRRAGEIAAWVDENYLNQEKPLYRAVQKRNTYTPSEVFDGWYQHDIMYGAGAGLDKLNADNRILQHLSARLISRQTARAQIDYLTDDSSEQEKIDAENVLDALLQRFATDPSTVMSILATVGTQMEKQGLTLTEALEKVQEQMQAAEQAQQQQALPAGAPGEALPAGQTGTVANAPAPALPSAPVQQVFVR
jgi:hypothetical protein